MKIHSIILLSWIFFLTSCSFDILPTQSVNDPNRSNEIPSQVIDQWIQLNKNSDTGVTIIQTETWVNMISINTGTVWSSSWFTWWDISLGSGENLLTMNLTGITNTGSTTDLEIQKIQAIKSLSWLQVDYPNLASAQKNDHPKFLELQKKKLMLQYYVSKIQNPEYHKLNEELLQLSIKKDSWPPDLIEVDGKIQELSIQIQNGQTQRRRRIGEDSATTHPAFS